MGKKSRLKKNREADQPKVESGYAGTPSKQKLYLALLCGLLAFLLYAPSIHYGYALDDELVVTQNKLVQQGVPAIPVILGSNSMAGVNNGTSTMYRPLSLVMLATEWNISPNNPALYHLINCLIYALSVAFLFLFLCRIFRNKTLLIPLLATLLFAAHPLHTEVVANIKSRDELMAFFFSLLSFIYVFRYADHQKKKHLFIAALLFFLALMSKESAAPMILVFPLLLYFFTDARRKTYLSVTGLLAATLLIQLLIRTLVLSEQEGNESVFLLIHNNIIAAEGLAQKAAFIFLLMGRYLLLLFYPHPLTSEYGYNHVPLTDWDQPGVILSALVHLGLAGICLYRFRKKEAWVFGILFYGISMILYTNILVTVGATMAERFLYAASAGFCITVTGLLSRFTGTSDARLPGSAKFRLAGLIIVVAIMAGSLKSLQRSADWKDNGHLFAADILTAPGSAAMNYRYGNHVLLARAIPQPEGELKSRMLDTAIAFMSEAIRIYPDYGDAFAQRSLAYYRSENLQASLTDSYKAISYKAASWSVYNNLGAIYGRRQMIDSAIYCFQISIKLDPDQPVPYKNLGNAIEVKGDYQAAVQTYLQALDRIRNSNMALQKEIYSYLSGCYGMLGNTKESERFLQLSR